MTVADLVKSFMESEMSVETVWEKTQAICAQYGIDPATLDDANAEFVAKEIDRENAGLAVIEDSGQLATTVTTEENSSKKKKKNVPTNTSANSDPIERLIPVIRDLHSTVSAQTGAMKDIVRGKVQQKKNSVVEELLSLTDSINEEILLDFTKGLEERAQATQSFLERFKGAFDEAWGS
jgi:hypothetical protein